MKVASCFISHNQGRDGALAQEIGVELGRRGILPWIDVHELVPGVGLIDALKGAIAQQTAICCLLSEASLSSAWVTEEFCHAVELSRADKARSNWIIPVFLGDPAKLTPMHPVLQTFMAQGDIPLNRLALVPRTESAADIADDIAKAVYKLMATQSAKAVSVVVDQRGAGPRVGPPELGGDGPTDEPTLLFRPDQGERSFHEVVKGGDWAALSNNYMQSLRRALGTLRQGRTVNLFGDGQLAWAWLSGVCLDRTTHIRLTATHGRSGQELSLDMRGMLEAPTGGNRWCHRTDVKHVPPLPRNEPLERVSLLLMKQIEGNKPVVDATRFIQATDGPPPILVWHPRRIDHGEQILELARDVTALLLRLKDEHRVHGVDLYTTLPFHAIPLFAALMRHVIDHWTFCEYDRSATDEGSRYARLPIPP